MATLDTVRTISDTRTHLTTIVRKLSESPEHEPIVIGSHRRPQAALVPYARVRPTPSLEHIQSKLGALKTLATAHGFSTVSVIGSVARGTATENSDVDLLCDSEVPLSLFAASTFESDAQQLLNFPVTVLTRRALDSHKDRGFSDGEVVLF